MKSKIVISISAALFIVLFCGLISAKAGFGDANTLFGRQYNADGAGVDPLAAYLDNPKGLAFDSQGNVYIADTMNNVIRKFDQTNNLITTYAGTGDFGRQDGFKPLATFGYPEDVEIDRDGNLYVADTLNNAIRKISGNQVRTIVKDGLSRPRGLMIRGDKLFIADTGHNRLLRCNLDGSQVMVEEKNLITPTKMDWAGNKVYFLNEGNNSVEEIDLTKRPGQEGRRRRVAGGFVSLGGISVFKGYLYVTAGRQGVLNEIYKINMATGETQLLKSRIETELLNYSSDLRFYRPDPTNQPQWFKMYVLFSGGNSLYRFDVDGGNEELLIGKFRYNNEFGPRAQANIGRPQALAMSPDARKMYLVANHKFAVFDFTTAKLTEIAGSPFDSYREGVGANVRVSDPTQTVMAADGKTLYFADRNNHRIRKIDVTTGTTAYITGAGKTNFWGSYEAYQEGGPCPDTTAMNVAGCAYFNRPTGIALSADASTLYVAEGSNNMIRAVDIATGETSLIAGNVEPGFEDGVGSNARFNGPFTLALSADGRGLYVTDKYNHAIRRVDLYSHEVNTLVGLTGQPGYQEGRFSRAKLSVPEYIVLDQETGNVYFTEAGNLRIRQLDLAVGVTRLVAGTGQRGKKNGPAGNSTWSGPKGLAIKGRTLFVADYYNDTVRYIDINR